MKFINDFLNNITMYRLVLYYLIFLLLAASALSLLGILPFSFFSLILTSVFLLATCIVTNFIFAKIFEAPANIESTYITALILTLIITPIRSIHDLPFLFWTGVLAIGSKYIVSLRKKHIFNPVAFSVVLTSLTIGGIASWWIGTLSMFPFVLLGFLIMRKIQKEDLVFYFLLISIFTILILSVFAGHDPIATLKKIIIDSPILFFAFIMLTEPLTTPPTKNLQIIYGMLIGFLFSPQVHFGSLYTTPETSLLIGNVFSFIVSSKEKLVLIVSEKIQIAKDTYDFVFANNKLNFIPGQYMEWTLGHKNTDDRGNRRYFTIASSPTEDNLRIGVKFYENSSSYKKSMLLMDQNTKIVAGEISGDFIMPKNPSKKLVFIAGGIGITPFRSMIKYLMDKNEKRDVILFYSNRNISEIVYSDIFEKAETALGIKTIYTLTDTDNIPADWTGKTGYINEDLIIQEVPDFRERVFYLSGSHSMVSSYEKVLKRMGVKDNKIKIDFFPGYA